MNKIFITTAIALIATCNIDAQFGFGGQQKQLELSDMHSREKIADINYANDGNAYHTLDVYLPEQTAEKSPVVIHIYGSAWFSNNSKGMADLGTICTAYLKNGYAVVCPNHRSSNDAKWPAQCHDIKAVIRWVRANAEKYNFDTNFIVTSGFSSGGHLASMMASTSGTKETIIGQLTIDLEGTIGENTDQSSTINACVDWSGPIDLEHMDCGGKLDMPMSPEAVLLDCPLAPENHDRYASLSPITYVDSNDVPVIIFHGTEDNVVPHCQGELWYNALKDKGVECEINLVNGGGHGFNMYSDENLEKMISFINKIRSKK